jgi:hypothetical protein
MRSPLPWDVVGRLCVGFTQAVKAKQGGHTHHMPVWTFTMLPRLPAGLAVRFQALLVALTQGVANAWVPMLACHATQTTGGHRNTAKCQCSGAVTVQACLTTAGTSGCHGLSRHPPGGDTLGDTLAEADNGTQFHPNRAEQPSTTTNRDVQAVRHASHCGGQLGPRQRPQLEGSRHGARGRGGVLGATGRCTVKPWTAHGTGRRSQDGGHGGHQPSHCLAGVPPRALQRQQHNTREWGYHKAQRSRHSSTRTPSIDTVEPPQADITEPSSRKRSGQQGR